MLFGHVAAFWVWIAASLAEEAAMLTFIYVPGTRWIPLVQPLEIYEARYQIVNHVPM